MNEEITCRRSLNSLSRRPAIATARQRLAQRALRQMEDSVNSGNGNSGVSNNSNSNTSNNTTTNNPYNSVSSSAYQILSLPNDPAVAGGENSPYYHNKHMSSSSVYIELESPAALVKKHGFTMLENDDGSPLSTFDDFCTSPSAIFKEPDELRTLCVVVSESDQKFFVNKDYLGAWSEQFRQFPNLSSTASDAYSTNHQVFHFPGNEAQFQLLLNVVWPLSKRFSLNQNVEIIKLCSQWIAHECLTQVASYYLHCSTHINTVEKLKLVSLCGNPLLLYGTLKYQCDREAIFNIVNQRPDDYAQIRKGPFASVTISKMLEHAAGDVDPSYKEVLAGHVERELSAFKRKLAERLDLSQPDDFRRSELLLGGASFFVNRPYLAAWSPVLRETFFGDYRERRQSRLRLDASSGTDTDASTPNAAANFGLFLSLLHPTVQAAALKMLPREYARHFRCNQWIDDLFSCIFGQSVETLLEVFKLAHRYQVAHLVEACLVFVETKADLSLADKLLMADAYHLPTLMTLCVAKMTSHRVVKRMVGENDHLLPNLSCQAHRIILDRLLALI